MSAIIRIKRSTGTSAPSSLKTAELAYTMGSGLYSNEGSRLFIGIGDDGSGNATSIATIGGKYYTDYFASVQAGQLLKDTGGRVVIVDANGKIDEWLVDNISINGNTIKATSGDLVLSADGANNVISAGPDAQNKKRITNLADPVNATDATNKQYVDNLVGGDAIRLSIVAGADSDSIVLADSDLTFNGDGSWLTASLTNNNITFTHSTDGAVGSYGSTTAIPVFTVDSAGHVISATTTSVATALSISDDAATTDTVNLLSDTLNFAGGTGLTSTVTDNTVTFDLDNTAVSAGSYGSATEIPTFTVDAQGRLTAASTASISTSFTLSDGSNTDTFNNGGTLTFTGGTGLTSSVTDDEVTFDLDDTTVTAGSYGSSTSIPTFTVDAQGRLTAAGSASISTTLSVGADTGSGDGVALASDTLTIAGGTGIATSISGDTVTVAGVDADSDVKGVASFSTTNFTVTNGDVAIKDTYVTSTARSAVSAVDAGGDGSFSYNSATGVFTYTGPSAAEVQAHFSAGTNTTYNAGQFSISDATIRSKISVTDNGGDGSLSYDNGTGVISYTGPSATEVRAHFSGGTGVDITNGVVSIGQPVATSDSVTFNALAVTNDMIIGGNLTVSGTQTIVNSTTLEIDDPIIHIAGSNETSDAVDMGWIGHYSEDGGSTKNHAGIIRKATDNEFYVIGSLQQAGLDSSIPDQNISWNDVNLGALHVSTIYGVYAGFDSDFGDKTTDNLTEGSTNLYYTNTRVDTFLSTALVAGEGIDITDGTNSFTISGEDATDTNKGIASFAAANFTVTNGAVTSNNITITADDTNTLAKTLGGSFSVVGDDRIHTSTNGTSLTLSVHSAGDSANAQGVASFHPDMFNNTGGHIGAKDFTVNGNTGSTSQTLGESFGIKGDGTIISTSVSGSDVTIAVADATTTTKGLASFSSDNFAVTSGAVTIKDGGVAAAELASTLDLSGHSVTLAAGEISNSELANSSLTVGSTTISLGGTSTTLAGLTLLDVDNIRVDGNAITSTDTNGNVNITPNGTGKTVITNLYLDSAGNSITEAIQDAIGNTFTFGTALNGFYADDSAGGIVVNADVATTSTLGVASFNSSDFSVTAGAVTLNIIDGGTF